jgi:hypothetical protein
MPAVSAGRAATTAGVIARSGSGGAPPAIPAAVPEDDLGEAPRRAWRLLTGHESGGLLLWCAASDALMPLVALGEPGSGPVRGLAVLSDAQLVAVAHAGGDMALFRAPADDEDWLLSPPCDPESSADTRSGHAAAAFASAAAFNSASGGIVGSANGGTNSAAVAAAAATTLPTTIKPRRLLLRTHRAAVAAAVGCGLGMVTASALGAIKLWSADALVREARRSGLIPCGVGAAAAAADAAGSAAAAAIAAAQISPRTTSDSSRYAEIDELIYK